MNTFLEKLLNMSAAGSVIIVAVVIFRLVLARVRAPRWIVCAMWGLVAFRLVCPISLSSPVSAFRVVPAVVNGSGEVEVLRFEEGDERLAQDVQNNEIPAAGPDISAGSTSPSPDSEAPEGGKGLSAWAAAYLVGLAAMLLYMVISTLAVRRKVSVSLRQRGNVRICDGLDAPFIMGIVRPVIYLPSSLGREERRYVLAHERAHLHRGDHIWKPLGFLILSLHFFNPLCWLAFVLFGRDMELACDERVIARLGRSERAAYSQTLLNVSTHRMLAACPVAFGESDVKRRVRSILRYRKPAIYITFLALAGCAVLTACFGTNPPRQDKDPATGQEAGSTDGAGDTSGTSGAVQDSAGSIGEMESQSGTSASESAESGSPAASEGARESSADTDDQPGSSEGIDDSHGSAAGTDDPPGSSDGIDDSHGSSAGTNAQQPSSVLPDGGTEEQHTEPVSITGGGVTIEPGLFLLYEMRWTGNEWILNDGPALTSLRSELESVPVLISTEGFTVDFGDYVRKSGLQLYDDSLALIRDSWYGDTALNWLLPGDYYGVLEVYGPLGQYIISEDSYEENVYNCVFRLSVSREGTAAYTPEKVSELKEARLSLPGEEYVLDDEAGLARLQEWLGNAEVLPGGAGCPFGSMLTVTCADGSTFSCCPAEDSCGVVFSNGVYYRYASDNEEFLALFKARYPWMGE